MAGDAAGYGLYITRSREIEPRRTYKCGAGWSVAIPEGYIGMIVSAGNLQVRTAIIDASNTGEIVLAVTNSRDDIQYIGAFSVFAKLIIIPCLAAGSVAADPSQGFGVDDQ
jgi:dUTPase